MIKYEDFNLTEKEYQRFLSQICAKKLSRYIKRYGTAPEEITDDFYTYT